MTYKRRQDVWFGTWLTVLLVMLITLSACATSSPVADGALWCDIYTPIYGVDDPAVHLNNAAYLEICLDPTEDATETGR